MVQKITNIIKNDFSNENLQSQENLFSENNLDEKENLQDNDFQIDENLILQDILLEDDLNLSDEELEQKILSTLSEEKRKRMQELKIFINNKIAQGENILTYKNFLKFKKLYPNKSDFYPYMKIPQSFDFNELLNCVKKSTFLINNDKFDLFWILKNYDKVISKKYENFRNNNEISYYTRF